MKLGAAKKTIRKLPFLKVGNVSVYMHANGHEIVSFTVETGATTKTFKVNNHKILPAFQALERYLKSKNPL